jgi:hypothetical protein
MTTTTTTSEPSSVTLDDLLALSSKLKELKPLDEWVVITPQGRVAGGKYEDVLKFMMLHHPMLNEPLFPLDRMQVPHI